MKLYQKAVKFLHRFVKSKTKFNLNKIANPLNMRIGSGVLIDMSPYELTLFDVVSIEDLEVKFDSEPSQYITDYVIKEVGSIGSLLSDKKIRHFDNQYYLLNLCEQHGYSEELLEVFNSSSITRVVENDTEVEYVRCNGVYKPYNIVTKNISDRNKDGKVTNDEVKLMENLLWDFQEEGTDNFVFVELDKSNGWIKVWLGKSLPRNFILST
jgi:hypothetical protein